MATPARPVPASWMVALLAIDGKQYVYRVCAPDAALPGDLFWAAFHCHEDACLPRALDSFDSAEIWQLPDRERAASAAPEGPAQDRRRPGEE